jgi:hypothetical protein
MRGVAAGPEKAVFFFRSILIETGGGRSATGSNLAKEICG